MSKSAVSASRLHPVLDPAVAAEARAPGRVVSRSRSTALLAQVIRFVVSAAVFLSWALPATAGSPKVESVDPEQAFTDVATEIRIRGLDFEPDVEARLDPGGPTEIGTYGEGVTSLDVAIRGRHAYVLGAGGRLHVVDLTDPTRPNVTGMTWVHREGRRIAVGDGVLVVAAGSGVMVVDVSDPHWPISVGWFGVGSRGSAVDVDIVGDHAFVAASTDGVIVLDVGNPSTPVEIGRVRVGRPTSSIVVGAGYAFATTDWKRLKVIDVHDASNPLYVHEVETLVAGGRAEIDGDDVLVFGKRAVPHGVGFYTSGSRAARVDVRSPESADLVWTTDFAEGPSSIASRGGDVFLGHQLGGIEVVDGRVDSSPSVVSRFGPATIRGLATDARRDLLLAATDETALRVYDIRAVRTPSRHRRIDLAGGSASRVAVRDHTAYAADGASGLHIVDVSNGAEPRLLGRFATQASSVAVGEERVFVGSPGTGLTIVDVSDPRAPSALGVWNGPTSPGHISEVTAVAVDGPLVYVAISRWGFRTPNRADLYVVDASDPAAAVEVGRLSIAYGTAVAVEKSGDHVLLGGSNFFGAFGGAIAAIDVSDPAAPAVSDVQSRLRGIVRDIAVVDGFAFSVGYTTGLSEGFLRVLDVSDPSRPGFVSERTTPGSPSGIAAEQGVAWIADGFAGVSRFDISDPVDPVLAEAIRLPESALDVATFDGRTWVAGGGLFELHSPPPLEAVRSPRPDVVHATVPEGYPPGPYHVVVSGDGGDDRLANGFVACLRRNLSGDLVPALSPDASTIVGRSVPWRLTVDGDAVFLGAPDRLRAALLLPNLPDDVSVRFEVVEDPGLTIVEVLRTATAELEVVLRGSDESVVRALWNDVRGRGGIDWPRSEDGSFGEVVLEKRDGRSTLGERPTSAFLESDPVRLYGTAVLYRYELDSGVLARARANGRDSDLIVETVGLDELGCRTAVRESFTRARVEACEELASQYGEFAVRCP